MKKLLIAALIFLLGAMFIDGLYHKDAPLMWLASTSVEYAYIRVALIAALLTLLFSSPPRSAAFRTFLMAFAGVIGLSTVLMSIFYAVPLLDAVVFIEVAIILMIEALESDVLPAKPFNFTKHHNRQMHV